MKLSIITTITNPDQRQDAWEEALECYSEIADELVIVNGGELFDGVYWKYPLEIKIVNLPWPKDWGWEELPIHLNAGLKEATGDWVIKLDIDQLIHEDNTRELKSRLEEAGRQQHPIASFQKMSIYAYQRFLQKGELNIAINKKDYGDRIAFGRDPNHYTDLCEPILINGKVDEKGVSLGSVLPVDRIVRTGISIWNFDYTFKTKEVAKDLFYQSSKAYKKYFGASKWGQNPEQSFEKLLKLFKSRQKESIYRITNLDILPKYIRERYRNLKKEEFGFNGWGLIPE